MSFRRTCDVQSSDGNLTTGLDEALGFDIPSTKQEQSKPARVCASSDLFASWSATLRNGGRDAIKRPSLGNNRINARGLETTSEMLSFGRIG